MQPTSRLPDIFRNRSVHLVNAQDAEAYAHAKIHQKIFLTLRQPGDLRPAPPTEQELRGPYISTSRVPSLTIAILTSSGETMTRRIEASALPAICAASEVSCLLYPETAAPPVTRMERVPVISPTVYMPALPPVANCCAVTRASHARVSAPLGSTPRAVLNGRPRLLLIIAVQLTTTTT